MKKLAAKPIDASARDMGTFQWWQAEAMAHLLTRYSKLPWDLTGNPNFLLVDYEDNLTPQQSIDQWFERDDDPN